MVVKKINLGFLLVKSLMTLVFLEIFTFISRELLLPVPFAETSSASAHAPPSEGRPALKVTVRLSARHSWTNQSKITPLPVSPSHSLFP